MYNQGRERKKNNNYSSNFSLRSKQIRLQCPTPLTVFVYTGSEFKIQITLSIQICRKPYVQVRNCNVLNCLKFILFETVLQNQNSPANIPNVTRRFNNTAPDISSRANFKVQVVSQSLNPLPTNELPHVYSKLDYVTCFQSCITCIPLLNFIAFIIGMAHTVLKRRKKKAPF